MIALVACALIFSAKASGEPLGCDPKAMAGVSEIYPTSDSLPENILRFYVYFDAPMRKEAALPQITLEDEDGARIDGALLANHYDLWSPDGTRLTLLLDPGRVKTGLEASEQLGSAIERGRRYKLIIGAGLQTARGCKLGVPHLKSFMATAPDVSAPDPERWEIAPPPWGSRDALKVRLDGFHDHISLAYRIRVQTNSGDTLPGRIDVAAGETEWRFTPQAPWRTGDFLLKVDPLLEDVAGNRLTGLFDSPSGENRRRQDSAASINLSFSIHPSNDD